MLAVWMETLPRMPSGAQAEGAGEGVRKRTAEPGDPLDKGWFPHRSPFADGCRDVTSAAPASVLSLSQRE